MMMIWTIKPKFNNQLTKKSSKKKKMLSNKQKKNSRILTLKINKTRANN